VTGGRRLRAVAFELVLVGVLVVAFYWLLTSGLLAEFARNFGQQVADQMSGPKPGP
jgi:hypothetical protein